jgi:MatE
LYCVSIDSLIFGCLFSSVVTWALLGALWDVLEAWTEGIGEAAATQVAFLLSVGQADRARNLSYGVVYMAVIQAMVISSALFMLGQYLAVIFSTDPTIQHLTNNSIAMIGVANVVMTFAQITWSLVGAQGRFRLGTAIIFFSRWLVTVPCAVVSIYVFLLDLNSVSGSLVVGYATASCALMFVIARSDWDRLVRLMQEMNLPFARAPRPSSGGHDDDGDAAAAVDPVLGLVNLDDFDDSSDGSDGIGLGGPDDDEGERVDQDMNRGVEGAPGGSSGGREPHRPTR